MSRRISSPNLVGRQVELQRLAATFDRASSGQPSLVLISGEAGVGKSRVVAEFCGRVEAAGGRTMTGGCLDLGEGGLPYAPFVESLRSLVHSVDQDARSSLFGEVPAELVNLVPDLRSIQRATRLADRSEGLQSRLFDAVIGVLGRLADDRPLVLVLEDLHWADGSTRDLIRFLVRNMRSERLLIVATYRSDDLHRRHPMMPLLTELERADRVERLELRRFDRDELREQLSGILGEAPAPALVEVMLERSDGLPFYVEELVAGLQVDAAQLPLTLRDILDRRLAALSPASLALVRAAAVIGGQFPHGRLAAVYGTDENGLMVALREATDARILVPIDGRDEPAYAFRHALLREAAYDDLLPAERVRLHACLADHLEALLGLAAAPDPSMVADFALHAYHAHDQRRALAGSVRALRVFVEAVAYREALGHAERALELWSRVDDATERAGIDHADLLAIAGRMASAANRPEHAMALTREALAELDGRGDRYRMAALLTELHWYEWESRAYDASVASAERAYELGASGDATLLKAQVTMSLGSQRWWQGRLHESARLLEEAMEVADTIGDRAAWAEAANLLAHTRADLGQGVQAARVLDQSSAIALDGEWRVGRISSLADRSIAALTCGRFAEAEHLGTVALELSRRYGWEGRFGSDFRSCIVDALFEQGRFDETEPLARPVLGVPGVHHAVWWMATSMARVAVAQGRFEEAHRLLDADMMGPTTNEYGFTMVAVADLARAEVHLLDVVEAVDAAPFGVDSEVAAPVWALLGLGVGACADGAAVVRRRRRPADVAAIGAHAERWLATLRTMAERHRAEGGAGPFFEAILATAEAEMSRVRGTPEPAAWADAVACWVALSHPFRIAHGRLRLAEAILDAGGDRNEASAILREAHESVSAIGAIPLRTEIEALAARARISLAAADADRLAEEDASAGPPSVVLTARERDVLRLVAEGHTNREIGDRLFISEKTVSVHVSNAMAKLGALSRYEAAAAAERLELL